MAESLGQLQNGYEVFLEKQLADLQTRLVAMHRAELRRIQGVSIADEETSKLGSPRGSTLGSPRGSALGSPRGSTALGSPGTSSLNLDGSNQGSPTSKIRPAKFQKGRPEGIQIVKKQVNPAAVKTVQETLTHSEEMATTSQDSLKSPRESEMQLRAKIKKALTDGSLGGFSDCSSNSSDHEHDLPPLMHNLSKVSERSLEVGDSSPLGDVISTSPASSPKRFSNPTGSASSSCGPSGLVLAESEKSTSRQVPDQPSWSIVPVEFKGVETSGLGPASQAGTSRRTSNASVSSWLQGSKLLGARRPSMSMMGATPLPDAGGSRRASNASMTSMMGATPLPHAGGSRRTSNASMLSKGSEVQFQSANTESPSSPKLDGSRRASNASMQSSRVRLHSAGPAAASSKPKQNFDRRKSLFGMPSARRPSSMSLLGNQSKAARALQSLGETKEEEEDDSDDSDTNSVSIIRPGALPGSVLEKAAKLREFSSADAASDASSQDSDFELLDTWKEGIAHRTRSHLSKCGKSVISLANVSASSDPAVTKLSCLQHCIVIPNSRTRLGWDLVGGIFSCYDLITVPLELAGFGMDSSWGLRALSWVGRWYWTLDIMVAGLTSFEREDGSMEMRLNVILQRYMRHELILDLALVAVTWAGLVSSASELRLFGMLRLLRLMRLHAFYQMVQNRISSERILLFGSLMQNLLGVAALIHVLACCWMILGHADGGWVASFEERGFVAIMTSSMTRLHFLTGQQNAHQRVLRHFLHVKQISPQLSARIQRNAKLALTVQQKNVPESDIELLGMISEPLLVELHHEMYTQTLMKHPLFEALGRNQVASMRKLCHTAVSSLAVARDQVIFSHGEQPASPSMIFLSHGTMRYSTNDRTWTSVEDGAWFAEHVLFTDWIFHGTLIAQSECQLTLVSAAGFQEQMRDEHFGADGGPDVHNYAREFMKKLHETEDEQRTDLGCLAECLECMPST